MLYIVPLQEEFDLTPLPHDAQEFSLMPKAECKKCQKIMPLQLLALHVKQCNTAECNTFSDSEPEVKISLHPAFLVRDVRQLYNKFNCFSTLGHTM